MPVITSFTASPASVIVGASTTLAWTTTLANGASLYLIDGTGTPQLIATMNASEAASGTRDVSPPGSVVAQPSSRMPRVPRQRQALRGGSARPRGTKARRRSRLRAWLSLFEVVEDGAVGAVVAGAARRQVPDGGRHRLELADLLLEGSDVLQRDPLHIRAMPGAVLP